MAVLEKLKKIFKGKYLAELKCLNCKNKRKVLIPRGVTIAEYKKIAVCDYCGCKYEDIVRKILEGDEVK